MRELRAAIAALRDFADRLEGMVNDSNPSRGTRNHVLWPHLFGEPVERLQV